MILPAGNLNNSQKGFTYIVVLVAIVVITILVEVVTVSNQYRIKRDKEKELLYRGQAYIRAIKSYYEAKPKFKVYPVSLDDLVLDPRFAFKRHLRRLYKDPLTNDDWQEIKGTTGGVIGVRSQSNKLPLKQENFPKGLEHLEAARQYSDWTFEYIPPVSRPKIKGNTRN